MSALGFHSWPERSGAPGQGSVSRTALSWSEFTERQHVDAIAVGVVSPVGIDNGKARPSADVVLVMTGGRGRSEWNEEW